MEPLTDQIVALSLADADLIRAAISSAYHHATVLDLAEQYRKLTQRPTPSNLTKALHNALTLLIAYIEEGETQEIDEAPPQVPPQ